MSSANKLNNASSTDELELTVDIFSEEENETVNVSSDEEMVGGPGLGYEAERSSRTPTVSFRDTDLRSLTSGDGQENGSEADVGSALQSQMSS